MTNVWLRNDHKFGGFGKVLIGLRFLAKGDFLSEVADLHGVSRSSACNIIKAFVDVINLKVDNIRFPDGRDLLKVKQCLFQKCKIPNTVGAVDGTLIPIVAPSMHENIFVCRKHFLALNIQAVVDYQMRFTDIVAKWPGSTHDSSIFDNCALKDALTERQIGHVLWDSGYPLRPYLLTPVLNPINPQYERYSLAQSRRRMVVERAFGHLKSRFRCLHKTGGNLYLTPGKACHAVVACAKLHNLCIERSVPMPEEAILDDMNDDVIFDNAPLEDALNYRDRIINLF